MTPIIVDGPAVEPVSVASMRAYLRLDHEAEDELIAGLVKAARLLVEASARRVLVEQRWRIVLDRWPAGRVLHLPVSPLIAVERIRIETAPGVFADLAAAAFAADRAGDPPRIAVGEAPEPGVPRGGIAVEIRAGYGATAEAVPEPLRLAIRRLVARWFENRGDVLGEQHLAADEMALLKPFQRVRL